MILCTRCRYPIKNGPEIRRLRVELAQIAKLEVAGGNQLKDVQTLKKIGEKEKLQEQLDYLMAYVCFSLFFSFLSFVNPLYYLFSYL